MGRREGGRLVFNVERQGGCMLLGLGVPQTPEYLASQEAHVSYSHPLCSLDPFLLLIAPSFSICKGRLLSGSVLSFSVQNIFIEQLLYTPGTGLAARDAGLDQGELSLRLV